MRRKHLLTQTVSGKTSKIIEAIPQKALIIWQLSKGRGETIILFFYSRCSRHKSKVKSRRFFSTRSTIHGCPAGLYVSRRTDMVFSCVRHAKAMFIWVPSVYKCVCVFFPCFVFWVRFKNDLSRRCFVFHPTRLPRSAADSLASSSARAEGCTRCLGSRNRPPSPGPMIRMAADRGVRTTAAAGRRISWTAWKTPGERPPVW